MNYQKICQNLISDLPDRVRDVIEQRFGLKSDQRKTLEEIGDSYGITRERVRQIEETGFLKMREKTKETKEVFGYFIDEIGKSGGLRREDKLLESLGGSKFQNHVFFLLTFGGNFKKFYQDKDLHSFWAVDNEAVDFAKEVLAFLQKKFGEIEKPLSFEEIKQEVASKFQRQLTDESLESILEISKRIQLGMDGKFGLSDWAEINPRGVKDKAYLVFKKEKRPLHFREVTQLLNSPQFVKMFGQKALVQTVHNELIKDQRFILVGRGLYALREWGYQPGVIKDIISMVLEKQEKPLTQEEIVKEVLKQRMVKVNTILINLKNQKYFQKNGEGKYQVREA
jgi:DNA-directed RNA polymerase delta subunit